MGYELYEYVGRLLCVDPHQWRFHASVMGGHSEAYVAEIYMHESRVWDVHYMNMWDDCCVQPHADGAITPLPGGVTMRGRYELYEYVGRLLCVATR